MNNKKELNFSFLLTLIVLTGAAFRALLLGAHTFHGDESLYAYWSIDMFKGKFLIFDRPYLLDKPPVYFFISGLFYSLMPLNELFAEVPNVISGKANIDLYQIVKG